MKIVLISIGKPHDKQIASAIDDFTSRAKKYFNVEWLIISPPKNAAVLNEPELKKAEAIILQNQIQKEDYIVLMDERGKQFSSVEFAQHIQQRANESCKRLVYIIGGAFGVDETIMTRANTICSFSKMVFPHQVFRLMLIEQVYRACTILKNEKYHHV